MIILELVLAAVIVWGGVAALRHIVSGVASSAAARMTPKQKARVTKAAKGARWTAAPVIEPVRHIKARAMAEVRAQHWLNKRKDRIERRRQRHDDIRSGVRVPLVARLTGASYVAAEPASRISVPGHEAQPEGRARKLAAGALSAVGAWNLLPGRVQGALCGCAACKGEKPHDVPSAAPASDVPAARHLQSVPSTPLPGRQTAMPTRHVPPDHASLIARVAGFEPESDADLLHFMAGEAAGMHGYAEAMEQLSDHLLSGVGLDPASVQGVSEHAQAVAEAAAVMARASARFQSVYQGVMETVANGTVLPHSGRFMTGEGA